MTKSIDIDTLMADTWLIVTQLRYGAKSLDGSLLYKNCCEQIEKVRQVLEQAKYDEETIDNITYAQCALLDESVMDRKSRMTSDNIDEGQKAWKAAPLQARYFNSLDAGDKLYERISNILLQPAPSIELLTCYQRILSLGFKGKYNREEIKREDILKELNKRVAPLDLKNNLLLQHRDKRRYQLFRSVWFWVIFVCIVCVSLWAGGHFWLQDLLIQQFSEPHYNAQ